LSQKVISTEVAQVVATALTYKDLCEVTETDGAAVLVHLAFGIGVDVIFALDKLVVSYCRFYKQIGSEFIHTDWKFYLVDF